MLTQNPITALVYTDSDEADRTLREIALIFMGKDWHLAGLVQHNILRAGRPRCDMELEDLASGKIISISQDRGPHAHGCSLDISQLLIAMQSVEDSLEQQPDLVLLNKFGKTEGEGAGLRPLIARVIEMGIPLIIAVPWRNIESWREFAGALSSEINLDTKGIDASAVCATLTSDYDRLHRSEVASSRSKPLTERREQAELPPV